MNKAVEILTVKKKLPLYKGEEPATAIELIQLEEVGFEIVAQKDLYQIGDKVVYIQPDYCLSDIPLFESFIRPRGDESNSMLGKVEGRPRRIRAKKFTLHKGDGNPVYSQGIMLPVEEVKKELDTTTLDNVNLPVALGITKYTPPEDGGGSGVRGGASRPFPEGMYKTDEENINNLWNHIEKYLTYPILLVGTMKVDGSSISLYYKDGKVGVCSRNLEKPLSSRRITGMKKRNFLQRLLFWRDFDLNIYEELPSDSDFVKVGKPYLDKIEEYCKQFKRNLVFRGELNGQGLKGSGNKNNPSVKETPNVKFYGVDTYDGDTIKLGEEEFTFLVDRIGLERCPIIFTKSFSSREELENYCREYFKTNMIEGIVVRTMDHKFSAKIMNPEYDSKK